MIMESSVKTFLGHQTASAVFAAPKHLYASCICLLNKTHVLCMGMGAGTSEQALFVATKTWERVRIGKNVFERRSGVCLTNLCVWSQPGVVALPLTLNHTCLVERHTPTKQQRHT